MAQYRNRDINWEIWHSTETGTITWRHGTVEKQRYLLYHVKQYGSRDINWESWHSMEAGKLTGRYSTVQKQEQLLEYMA